MWLFKAHLSRWSISCFHDCFDHLLIPYWTPVRTIEKVSSEERTALVLVSYHSLLHPRILCAVLQVFPDGFTLGSHCYTDAINISLRWLLVNPVQHGMVKWQTGSHQVGKEEEKIVATLLFLINHLSIPLCFFPCLLTFLPWKKSPHICGKMLIKIVPGSKQRKLHVQMGRKWLKIITPFPLIS